MRARPHLFATLVAVAASLACHWCVLLDDVLQRLVERSGGRRRRMQLTFPSSITAQLAVLLDNVLAYDGPIHASPYATTPFVFAGIDIAENGGQARTIDFDDVLVTSA